jgi:hypothetical protein
MKPLGFIIALMVVSVGAKLQANPAPAAMRAMSLQDCLQMALQHNLDLQIDRYNPQIARFALNAAHGPYDPSFSISGQHDHTEAGSKLLSGGFSVPGARSDDNGGSSTLGGLTPWGMTYGLQGNTMDSYGHSAGATGGFESSAATTSFTLTQPLLKNAWIDAPRLNIRVSKNRLKYSELQLQLQIMQTANSVETAYYDLIYDRASVEVQQKAVQLAEELVAQNKKRVEVGAMAVLDLESAQAQAASTRATLIAAESTRDTQERLLKHFITDEFSKWQPIEVVPSGSLSSAPLDLNLQDSWGRGLAQRPDLLQARLDLEKVGIQLKYDRNQLFPQLDAFGTYGYNGSGREFSGALYDVQQMDRRLYAYGGRLTIPLSNMSARNAYKSDKATLQQIVLALKKLEQNIMIQIDNDVGLLRANYEQVQATRAAREYQEQALAAEQKKLENGKSTTYVVLQVQRDLTTARAQEILALDTYNKSRSQLSLDEGSILTRLGLDVEVK